MQRQNLEQPPHIYFAFIDPVHLDEFRNAFGKDLPNVSFERANLTQLATAESVDCLMTTGNSFGRMDGGVDGAVNAMMTTAEPNADYFHERVQRVIGETYRGEQPVGTCLLIKTHHTAVPYVAHVPTMRVPHDVGSTLNAYLAFRALLVDIRRRPNDVNVRKVACTPCCTGSGGMSITRSAKQMRAAYDTVFDATKVMQDPTDWVSLHRFHRHLASL